MPLAISTENPQMLVPAYNGNPPTWESQALVDDRFMDNCKAEFPAITGTTVPTVTTQLRGQVLPILKTEIDDDPEDRGYDGKTNQQIADLVSDSYMVGDVPTLARLAIIWENAPYVPNMVTADDVAEAMS